jgi:hypothetical protein
LIGEEVAHQLDSDLDLRGGHVRDHLAEPGDALDHRVVADPEEREGDHHDCEHQDRDEQTEDPGRHPAFSIRHGCLDSRGRSGRRL